MGGVCQMVQAVKAHGASASQRAAGYARAVR